MRIKLLVIAVCTLIASSVTARGEGFYRPTVAIQPFLDTSEGAEDYIPKPPGSGTELDVKGLMPWLSAGIPEMLYFILERTYTVNLVTSSDLRSELKKRGIELSADTPLAEVVEAARPKGAEYVIKGEYDKKEEDIAIRVSVYAVDGSAVGTREVSGKIGDIFAMEEEAAKAVLNVLGISYDRKVFLHDPTSSLEAYRWFSEGSGKYYTGERIANFERALAIDADFVEVHLKTAEANRLEGSFEQARASYEKARTLADVYPEAPTYIGYIVTKTSPEATEDAIAYYKEALAMDPAYPDAVELIGTLYFKREDYKTAERYFDQLIETQPRNARGFYLKGNVLWVTGSTSANWQEIYKNALTQYTEAIIRDPKFAEAYYNRGSIYKTFEDKEAAAADYIQYIRLKPDSPYKEDICETLKLWGVEIPTDLGCE